MFKTRLLSGIVLVAAALVPYYHGGDVLLFSTLLISYIGMFELFRIFHVEKELPGIVGYLAATVFYCNLKWAFLPDLMVVVLGFLMALMFVYVFTYPKYKTEQMLAVFFRCVLCGCDAFLCISDENAHRGCLYRMADLFVLLGM